MLSRRKFLKTGLTTGAAAIPLASVLDAAQQPDQHAAMLDTVDPGVRNDRDACALGEIGSGLRAVAKQSSPRGPDEHDRARPRGDERGRVGRLLAFVQGRRGVCERDGHPGFLSLQSAVSPARKIPQRPRFLRRVRGRRKETRHARGGAHEPRPELGRCARGAPGVGHAPQGRLGAVQHRGAAALQDVHVLHLHGRLRAGHDARNQLAL